MSYIDTALTSIPIAFYAMDEQSGTNCFDISGFSRDAMYSDEPGPGASPLVSGTVRGTKLYSEKYITYPTMPIWSKGMNSYSFSIEFWLYEYSSQDQFTIFAPTDTDGQIIGSGIYYQDGKITFSIGDGTGVLDPLNTILIELHVDDINVAHHIVCIYSGTSVSIVIDGGKQIESYQQVVKQNLWTYDLTGFITMANSTDSFVIDCLAIYDRRLSIEEMKQHYLQGWKTQTQSEISSRYSGVPIHVDNQGSIASLKFNQPSGAHWNTFYQDNLSQDKGSLKLNRILQPSLSDGADPVFISSSLELQPLQSLPIGKFNTYVGSAQGGVSGSFYLDSGLHDNLDEFCLFTIASSTSDSMSVVKDTSGNLVLRHTFYDIQTLDFISYDTVHSPVTFDQYANILLVWFKGIWSLYYDNTSAPVVYTDAQHKSFSIADSQRFILGATIDDMLHFNSKIKQISLHKKIPDLTSYSSIFTTIYSYTLKLESNLLVSQSGHAVFYINASSVKETTEARINYFPISENILVEYSYDQTSWTPVVSGANIPGFTYNDNISDTNKFHYVKVTLQTNDSINDITSFDKLLVEFYNQSKFISNRYGFYGTPYTQFNTGYLHPPVISKYNLNGVSLSGEGYVDISAPPLDGFTLDDGRPHIAQLPPTFKSVELIIKRNDSDTSGTHMFHNNGTEFSLLTDGSNLSINGFDRLYINGYLQTDPYQFILGEWTHVILSSEDVGYIRENLIRNPRLGIDSTDWNPYSEADEDITSAVAPPFGSQSYKITTNTTSTSDFGFNLSTGVDSYPATEGKNYVASVFLQAATVERNATVGIIFYDSLGAQLLETRSNSFSDYIGSWSWFAVEEVAPVDTAYVTLDIRYEAGIPSSEDHYAANAMIGAAPSFWPYFDGDFSDASWDGTEDASSSTIYLGILIDDSHKIFINCDDALSSFGPPTSYTDITLYPITIDDTSAYNNYSSYFGRNISIIDGGAMSQDLGYFDSDLPMDIGELEDLEVITDHSPFAVAANWENFVSGS